MKIFGKMALIAIMAASSFVALAGEDYTILLTRPEKVGDKMNISATGESSNTQTVTAGGQVVKNLKNEYSVALEGVVTVLKVDTLKRSVESNLEVSKLTKTDKATGKTVELLSKGTVVHARANGKKDEFLVDGKPLPPETQAALNMFIKFPKNDATDNDVFGTKEKKKVGDSWPINKKRIAQDLTKEKINVKPEDVSGKTTLEKVVEVDGEKCLVLSAWMKIENVKFAAFPGMKVKKGDMKADFSGNFPVDPAKQPKTEDSKKIFSIEMEGKPNPQGPVMNIKVEQKNSTKISLTPVK